MVTETLATGHGPSALPNAGSAVQASELRLATRFAESVLRRVGGHCQPVDGDQSLAYGIGGEEELLEGDRTEKWSDIILAEDDQGHLLAPVELNPSTRHIPFALRTVRQFESRRAVRHYAKTPKHGAGQHSVCRVGIDERFDGFEAVTLLVADLELDVKSTHR